MAFVLRNPRRRVGANRRLAPANSGGAILSYVWPVLMIFLTGAVPALLFILLLWKRYRVLIPVLLLILIILETAVTVFLLYGGGFFGAGALCLAVPVAACSIVMGYMGSMWTDARFELYECPTERVTLLIVPSVLFDFIERYNLTTGGWSKTSLWDGMWSYLK